MTKIKLNLRNVAAIAACVAAVKKVVIACMLLFLSPDIYGQEIGGRLTPKTGWRIVNDTLYISGVGFLSSATFDPESAWKKNISRFHSVVIEDGITEVAWVAIKLLRFKNVTSLTFAGSVRYLGPYAFSGCFPKLSVVEFRGAFPPDMGGAIFAGMKFKKAKLIVPTGKKETYLNDPLSSLYWKLFRTIEESDYPSDMPLPSTITLSNPCTIHLRKTTFVSPLIKFRVFLNGIEYEKLGNANTVLIQTDRAWNELRIQKDTKSIGIGSTKELVSYRRFDATAGGDVHIEFSTFKYGYYTRIMDKKDIE